MITNTTETTIVRAQNTATGWQTHEYPVGWLCLSTGVYVVHFIECVRLMTEIAIPAGFDNLDRARFTNNFAVFDSDDPKKLFIV